MTTPPRLITSEFVLVLHAFVVFHVLYQMTSPMLQPAKFPLSSLSDAVMSRPPEAAALESLTSITRKYVVLAERSMPVLVKVSTWSELELVKAGLVRVPRELPGDPLDSV